MADDNPRPDILQSVSEQTAQPHVVRRLPDARSGRPWGNDVPQILVVDDEPSVLEMVGELLTQEGFKVKLAATDVDALSILQREAKQTAVLLADINLGLGVTGIDIARKAVAMSPSLEVVYLTGNPDLLTRVGIDKSLIVVKPFQPADLIGRLKTIMRNKR